MAISRRDFGVSVGALFACGFGKADALGLPAIGTYPIAPNVHTTVQRTVLPNQKPAAAIRVDDVSNYRKRGFAPGTTAPRCPMTGGSIWSPRPEPANRPATSRGC